MMVYLIMQMVLKMEKNLYQNKNKKIMVKFKRFDIELLPDTDINYHPKGKLMLAKEVQRAFVPANVKRVARVKINDMVQGATQYEVVLEKGYIIVADPDFPKE